MARLRLLGLLLVVTTVGACGNITRKSDSDAGTDSTVVMIDAAPDAPAPAVLEADKTVYDFGTVTEGTTGGTTAFTIKNSGASTSGTIQAATITGAGAASFGIISDTCMNTTLNVGSTCSIVVQFSPPLAGSISATLNVSASPGGSVMAVLSGVAVTPASISITPAPFDFGNVVKTQASAAQTFTVKNNGGSTTGTLAIATSGTDMSQFQISGTTCTTLTAGATCTFDAKFAPTTARGVKSASITVTGSPGGTAIAGVSGTSNEKYTLSVNRTGSSGTGTIASTPGTEINCDPSNTDCSEIYTVGVTAPTQMLTATAATGSRFGTFSNACTGNTCSVTMDADKTVTATFIKLYDLTVTVNSTGGGVGTVTSTSNPTQTAQVNCGNGNTACTVSYDTGTTVTLTAATTGLNKFNGWGGACTSAGTNATCNVSMSMAQNVTATFTSLQTLTVTLTGSGAGSVSSSPAGITCGADCTENYPYNTSVTLTATPTLPDAFVGWSGGGCAANVNPCVTTVTAAMTVTAKFDKVIRATWDPAFNNGGLTYSSSNLSVSRPSTTTVVKNARSNIGKASGKWYWEVLVDAGVSTTNAGGIGITEAITNPGTSYYGLDGTAMSFGYGPSNAYYSSWTGATMSGSPPAAIATGKRYMFALDMDNKKLWIGEDGTWVNAGNPSTGLNPVMTGLTGTVFPGITFYGNGTAAVGNGFTANFGATAFTYAVPSGFNAGLFGYPITWDPTWSLTGITYSNGNLSMTAATSGTKNARTTVGKKSGKWYWEVKADAGVSGSNQGGLGAMDATMVNSASWIGNATNGTNGISFGYADGTMYSTWTGTTLNLSAAPSTAGVNTGNVYMFALDMTANAAAGRLYIGMNGVWFNTGDPVAGTGSVLQGIPYTQAVHAGVTFYTTSTNAFTGNFFNNYVYARPPGYAPLID